MKLTPADIQKPSNASGYQQVGRAGGLSGRPTNGKPWAAYANRGRKGDWRGPRRATALEAAQDYCDYVNGDPVALKAALKRAVRSSDSTRDPMDDNEVKAALGVLRDARAQRQGRQGYVYLIGEVGRWDAVKVGYSVKPSARVSELQTGNSRQLQLLAALPGTEADERALHMKYIDDNILLEWFKPSASLFAEFGLERNAS